MGSGDRILAFVFVKQELCQLNHLPSFRIHRCLSVCLSIITYLNKSIIFYFYLITSQKKSQINLLWETSRHIKLSALKPGMDGLKDCGRYLPLKQ